MPSSASPRPSDDSGRIVPTDLDVPVLVGLVAPAVEAHVLHTLRASGHDGVRAVHGYVFQRLLQGPCTVGSLASDLDVTQQRVSTLVDELVAGQYVQRRHRPDDGRVREVVLTDRGREVVELARGSRADLETRLEEQVGDLAPVRLALAALLDLTGNLAEVTERQVPLPPA